MKQGIFQRNLVAEPQNDHEWHANDGKRHHSKPHRYGWVVRFLYLCNKGTQCQVHCPLEISQFVDPTYIHLCPMVSTEPSAVPPITLCSHCTRVVPSETSFETKAVATQTWTVAFADGVAGK